MLEVSWTDWCGSGVEQVHRAPPPPGGNPEAED